MSDEPTLTVDNFGNKRWWVDGKLHRLDGPAYEIANGRIKAWFLNGKLHRLDGPACEWEDGTKEWFVNGKRHRLDGPAYEHTNGYKEWWMYGKKVSEEECLANQIKITRIQRRWRNQRLMRFVRLTTKNKQFIQMFYSPEGKGGIWHKRKMMSALQKMID